MNDEMVDSDEEKEKEEADKEVSESKVIFTSGAPPAGVTSLVAFERGDAMALAKIVLDGKLVEVGKAETLYKEKTKDSLQLYHMAEGNALVIYPTETLKGSFQGQIMDQLFTLIPSVKRVLTLGSLYKTHYTDTNMYYSSDDGAIPLKYYKTSYTQADADLNTYLGKIQPSAVMNIKGGIGGALLMEAEMRGVSGAVITAITDSHYVTAEILQAFGPVVTDVLKVGGINFGDI